MDLASGTTSPHRQRIAVPDGRRAWAGSSAQKEWSRAFETVAWDRRSSDDFICVLPHLMGGSPLPSCVLEHFADRLASPHGAAAPRPFLPRWLAKRPIAARAEATGGAARPQVPPTTRAELKVLFDALRLGMTLPYEPQLAASLAFWIGLHPVHVWQEALLSHEMFLTLGWLGLLRYRGGAWMPAAVAEYLFDVIEIDSSGHYHVAEPLLAEAMAGHEIRVVLAGAVESRLQRDEVFLHWPTPVLPSGRVEP